MELTRDEKRLRKDFIKSIGGSFLPNESLYIENQGTCNYAGTYEINKNEKTVEVGVYSNGKRLGGGRKMPLVTEIKGVEYSIKYRITKKPEVEHGEWIPIKVNSQKNPDIPIERTQLEQKVEYVDEPEERPENTLLGAFFPKSDDLGDYNPGFA